MGKQKFCSFALLGKHKAPVSTTRNILIDFFENQRKKICKPYYYREFTANFIFTLNKTGQTENLCFCAFGEVQGVCFNHPQYLNGLFWNSKEKNFKRCFSRVFTGNVMLKMQKKYKQETCVGIFGDVGCLLLTPRGSLWVILKIKRKKNVIFLLIIAMFFLEIKKLFEF